LENGKYLQFRNSSLKTKSVLIGKKHIRMFFRKENEDKIIVLLFFDAAGSAKKILDLLP